MRLRCPNFFWNSSRLEQEVQMKLIMKLNFSGAEQQRIIKRQKEINSSLNVSEVNGTLVMQFYWNNSLKLS